MGLMAGKRGLIVGVANDHSLAYHIALSLQREGAECLFTHLPGEKMQRRCTKALERGGFVDPWLAPMDAGVDDDLDRVFDSIGAEDGRLDFLVHSIAFADREWLKDGSFTATPREAFLRALDISVFTKMAMAHRAAPLMSEGGSIMSLSYYGAEKAVKGYNVMGVAKAALESATRYLSLELGSSNIRVNTISAGPCKTLSAMGVGGFSTILRTVEEHAPLGRNVTGQDIGDSALYLLSDLSGGMTGQVLHVDCGYSVVGF